MYKSPVKSNGAEDLPTKAAAALRARGEASLEELQTKLQEEGITATEGEILTALHEWRENSMQDAFEQLPSGRVRYAPSK